MTTERTKAHKFIKILTVLICTIILAACKNEPKDDLYGKWTMNLEKTIDYIQAQTERSDTDKQQLIAKLRKIEPSSVNINFNEDASMTGYLPAKNEIRFGSGYKWWCCMQIESEIVIKAWPLGQEFNQSSSIKNIFVTFNSEREITIQTEQGVGNREIGIVYTKN